MTLKPDEFIRRFLLHVLPPGCHRIRHYRHLANARRRANLVRARKPIQVLDQPDFPEAAPEAANDNKSVRRWTAWRSGGGGMIVVEVLTRPDRHHRIKRLDSS